MIQLVVIVIYLALLVGLGLSANRLFRGTAKDYMLASHSIGPFLLLMSLFGTTMTAFALVGSTGRAFTLGVGVYGLLASASGIIHSLCFFVIGVPLWSLGRRNGYTTQIQFFRDRLESDLIGLLLFPILVVLVICYLLLGVVGGGAVVSSVTPLPSWAASAAICGVVLTYVFLGGMRGAAWANAFQTMVFLVLGVVTFVVIANAIGGGSGLVENMQRATEALVDTTPREIVREAGVSDEDYEALVEAEAAAQGSANANVTRKKLHWPIFFSFLFIPLSVGMFPHVFQHWLTAKSAETFKVPIIVHPIFILIVWLPCVLLGAWASEPGVVPNGTLENEVLATLVSQNAGPILGGLLTAGILAAIMSSLDSQFLCLGTMFTQDVLLHYRREAKTTEQQTVFTARCFVIAIVVVTYLLSLRPPPAVFDLGLWSFSGFTGLFPLVFAAIYWRRLTAPGAIASIGTTIGVWLVLFARSDFGVNKRYGFPEQDTIFTVGGLIPTMLPVVTITLASTVVLVIVSLMTKPPSDKTLARFFG